MKIIHVVLGKANPERANGVNKVAYALATTQIRAGHSVEIWGLTNSKSKDDVQREYQLRIFPRHRFCLDMELKNAIKQIENNKKDVIFHLHGGFIFDVYLIAKLLKKKNLKYILTPHGCYNKESLKRSHFKKRIFFILFDSCVLRNASKVHFVGQSEYDYMDSLIQGIHKVLIPNGQNFEELKYEFRKMALNTRPVFGFVGRIDIRHKGLDILVEGFKEYKNAGGKGILWIIGGGDDINILKYMAKKFSIEKDVVFFGPKFGSEKLNLIANMNVFVHTSRYEGLPIAVLEAAALGKPLLVSSETNFGDYVTRFNCGIVLSENTAGMVQNSLFTFEHLFYSEKLSSLSANSLNMVKEKFSWADISAQLLENI